MGNPEDIAHVPVTRLSASAALKLTGVRGRVSVRQVIQLCEKKRAPQPKYIVADTPGQIEIFTWSASGAIITEAFASTFPTMVAFVIDTPRSAAPQTFMTNMLQVGHGGSISKILPSLLAYSCVTVGVFHCTVSTCIHVVQQIAGCRNHAHVI